jgi:poly(3-hydroxybutyrate) depolymerase
MKLRLVGILAAAAVALLDCGTGGSPPGTGAAGASGSPVRGVADATTGQPDATISLGGGGDASTSADDAASGEGDGAVASDGADDLDSAIVDASPADAGPPVVCTASLAAGDYEQTMPTDAGLRAFQVHVPPGLDPTQPAPLVFAFHGGGENAWQFEQFAHIHDKADAAGFILVEADGTPALGPSVVPPPSPEAGIVLEVWNAGNCCEYASQVNANVDDVGFVRMMIDSIEAQTCIDPKRVFATGFSNGGMLSHRLACQLSDRIASIVAVSGGSGATDYDMTPPETLFDCTPGRPVPVLHIHGTQDACYPFDGGWGPPVARHVRARDDDDPGLGAAQRVRRRRPDERVHERRGDVRSLPVPARGPGRALRHRRRRTLLAGRRPMGREHRVLRKRPGLSLFRHRRQRRVLDLVH